MYYAATINKGHMYYNENIKDTLEQFKLDGHFYCEIVNHANDHYHALIGTTYDLEKYVTFKSYHFERVRNIKAYQKYMYSHDLIEQYSFGEIGYHENDSIVDSVINIGALRTVQKYGWSALRYYKQLKEFELDFKQKGNESYETD